MTYAELWHRLIPLYEPHEAQAIVRGLLSALFDMTLTDIVSGKVTELSAESQHLVEEKMQRLAKSEPLQYVTGRTWFAGRQFHVDRSVLIPRPETEELCRIILNDYNRPYCALQPPKPLRILDIGTGSGCIAITLALGIGNSDVEAWDISPDALLVARDNAHCLQARVSFSLHDILQTDVLPVPADEDKYDIIVSNPPYVLQSERLSMHRNVVGYEPGGALFVPDADPLLFYRAIGIYAAKALKAGGRLYFETNERKAGEVASLLLTLSFKQATVRDDQFGKNRFVISYF